MREQLFLCSYFKAVSQVFNQKVPNLKGKTVTFIPTASHVETVKFFVDNGRKALESLGMIVDILELSESKPQEIKKKLKQNDFIYVTGGNSFFLLQEMRRTGTDQVILEEIAKGKVYIGESAGAIVLGENIDYISHMDSPKKAKELLSFDGLNVTPFFIVPHFDTSPFKKITKDIVARKDLNTIAITNKEAMWISTGVVEIL